MKIKQNTTSAEKKSRESEVIKTLYVVQRGLIRFTYLAIERILFSETCFLVLWEYVLFVFATIRCFLTAMFPSWDLTHFLPNLFSSQILLILTNVLA